MPTDGRRFADYCAKYIKHTIGNQWAGRPLIFEPWQQAFWDEALEYDQDSGRRLYQQVGLGLPRKNGKSAMASAAGIYMLDSWGEGEASPQVLVGAGARAQAGVVMGQSIDMVRNSPLLLDRLKHRKYSIECPRNGGIMRSLAADAPLQHGLNPSCNIIDELHAHKGGGLFTALTTGTGAREQPITLWITTAGVAGEGILADLYDSMFTGSGTLERRGSLLIYRNPAAGTLIFWYGADKDADIEDPAVWMGANPASWRDEASMAAEFASLRDRGALLEWRRYHLNQFVGFEATWLPDGKWAGGISDVPLNVALPVGVGIDKSPTGDVGAIVVAQRQGDRVVVRFEIFAPEAATGMASTEAMRQRLRELRAEYPSPMTKDDKTRRLLPGPAYGFDRQAFDESAEMLDADGLNMVQLPLTASIMAPPSMVTYELITTGRLVHDGDQILAEHVANTNAKLTDRGMQVTRPKAGSSRVNVGCVAMVRAVALAMQEAPTPYVRKPRVAVGF